MGDWLGVISFLKHLSWFPWIWVSVFCHAFFFRLISKCLEKNSMMWCFFFSLSDLISPLKPTIYINILEFYKSNYYFHLFKSYFYFYVPWFFMSIKKLLSLLCFGSFLICFIEINYYKNNYIHSQMIN